MMRAYHVGPWDPNVDMPYDCNHGSSKVAQGAFQDPTTEAGASLSLALSPNPMNPSTTISFALPQSAHVRLTVFDVRGRLVKVLMHGNQNAGEHHVIWNGQNQAGVAVASGTYFARIETDRGSLVQKMVLVE